jgi:hypothetical protein
MALHSYLFMNRMAANQWNNTEHIYESYVTTYDCLATRPQAEKNGEHCRKEFYTLKLECLYGKCLLCDMYFQALLCYNELWKSSQSQFYTIITNL